VTAAEANNLIQMSTSGRVCMQKVEGAETFDVILCWPRRMRGEGIELLDAPADVLIQPPGPGTGTAPGTTLPGPRPAEPAITSVPRVRLRDLVTPIDAKGKPDPEGSFLRSGAATIYRENGKRLSAVLFRVRDHDQIPAVLTAVKRIVKPPYGVELER
jgi:cobalt-zinc-cadmium resistance protein CzcA